MGNLWERRPVRPFPEMLLLQRHLVLRRQLQPPPQRMHLEHLERQVLELLSDRSRWYPHHLL